MRIGENLELDVTWRDHQFFQEDAIVAEGRQRLALRPCQRLRELSG